jgi:hypothetical protein
MRMRNAEQYVRVLPQEDPESCVIELWDTPRVGAFDMEDDCPACKGRGDDGCLTCGGEGYV